MSFSNSLINRFRQRESQIPHVHCSYQYEGPQGQSGTNDGGTVYTEFSKKSIWDVEKPYGSGVWPYMPCRIYSRTVNAPPGRYNGTMLLGPFKDWKFYGTESGWMSNTGAVNWPEINQTWSGSGYSMTEAEQWNRLADELDSKLPSMTNGAPDILLNLIEAAQILQTFNFVEGLEAKLRHAGNTVRFSRSGAYNLAHSFQFGAQDGHQLAVAASGGHLSYAFGVAPVIRDLCQLIEQLATFRDSIKRLRQGCKKMHDLDCGVADGATYEKYIPLEPCGYAGTSCPHRVGRRCGTHYVVKYRRVFRTCVKYSYTWPEQLGLWERQVGEFLSALGIKGGFRSFWEHIPFSFVIDWLFNARKLFEILHLWRFGGYDVKLVIHENMLSRRDDVDLSGLYKACHYESHCWESSRNYERWNGRVTDQRPWLLSPGIRQIALGTSLLVQLTA